jgi:hypothetical protein
LVSLVSDICITNSRGHKKRCINYLLENHFTYLHLFLSSLSVFPSSTGTFFSTTITSPFTLAAAFTVPAAAFEATHIELIGSTTSFVHSRQRQQMLLLDEDIGLIL